MCKKVKMSKLYARPLIDHKSIDAFLVNCLGATATIKLHKSNPLTHKVAQKIRDAESAVSKIDPSASTLAGDTNRFPQYSSAAARADLRKRIIKELTTLDRLDSDDKIKLGRGGAKPQGKGAVAGKQAYIIIGLPASGKSSLVSKISDSLGAVILDSDFAKRKIPEFKDTLSGAQLVHTESSNLVFGDAPSLLAACLFNNHNIVIPTIGQDEDDLNERRDSLIDAGYDVHLTLTYLPRQIATTRALERFLETDRYVPLCLIFDGYANDPIMNYYKARANKQNGKYRWASFGALSTVSFPAQIIDSTEKNPVLLLKEEK